MSGVIERTPRLLYDYAGVYSLRTLLEDVDAHRFSPIADRLTPKHWIVVFKEVLNRAEDNAIECGEWLEAAADNGWSAMGAKAMGRLRLQVES